MMEKEKFDKLDKLSGDVYAKFEDLYKKGAFTDLEAKIAKICSDLSENYSVFFNIGLDVFDSTKEKEITLGKCGICCFGGKKPYKATGGSATIHTYIVNGKIEKVPHDYCPNCWGGWGFKLMHTTCPECGVVMGKEIKILLDTSVCPSCEKGTLSRAKPQCDKCGYVIDTNVIHWG